MLFAPNAELLSVCQRFECVKSLLRWASCVTFRIDFKGFLVGSAQSSTLQKTFPDVTVHEVGALELWYLTHSIILVLISNELSVHVSDPGIISSTHYCCCTATFRPLGFMPFHWSMINVAQGFMKQFQSVTDMAPTPAENITAVLYQLSGMKPVCESQSPEVSMISSCSCEIMNEDWHE